jgi:hypothetical protein
MLELTTSSRTGPAHMQESVEPSVPSSHVKPSLQRDLPSGTQLQPAAHPAGSFSQAPTFPGVGTKQKRPCTHRAATEQDCPSCLDAGCTHATV